MEREVVPPEKGEDLEIFIEPKRFITVVTLLTSAFWTPWVFAGQPQVASRVTFICMTVVLTQCAADYLVKRLAKR
jgi:hypothetical protein